MTHDPALQEPFDYGMLDEQTREIVLRKTDETRGLMMRTTEHIIAIGENLLTVQKQLPEVKFSAWLCTEFALSRQSAYNFMKVASKFGGSCKMVLQLPASVLYELASSSEAIVEQVEAGELPPTLNAIREVEKRVVPPEILMQLETLQQNIVTLTEQRDTLSKQVSELHDEVRELACRFLEECDRLAQGTSGGIVDGSRVCSEVSS